MSCETNGTGNSPKTKSQRYTGYVCNDPGAGGLAVQNCRLTSPKFIIMTPGENHSELISKDTVDLSPNLVCKTREPLMQYGPMGGQKHNCDSHAHDRREATPEM